MISVALDCRGRLTVWLQGIFVSASPAMLQATRATPAAQQSDLMMFRTWVVLHWFPALPTQSVRRSGEAKMVDMVGFESHFDAAIRLDVERKSVY